MIQTLRTTALLVATLFAIFTTSAALADFGAHDSDWAGLSRLVDAGRDIGIRVEPVNRVDVSTLTPQDALIIVHPTGALPEDALGAFLRAGGRVAIADDFGKGDQLLRPYQITRRDPGRGTHQMLRDNPQWLVATPASTHPLTRDVRGLLTNHPRVVSHHALEAIFSFNIAEPAVITGAVGEGRIVVIGDASVLINQMLALGDNRKFAENLIKYLGQERNGRVLLVTNDAPILGIYGEPSARTQLSAWASTLSRMAKFDLPAPVLSWVTASLAFFLVIAAWTSLPRRSPYEAPAITHADSGSGGFVGRVAFFRDRDVNLLQPLLVYRTNFEQKLLTLTHQPNGASLQDVVAALRSRGETKETVDALRALLIELDGISKAAEEVASAPRVNERRLHEFMQRGDALLALLSKPQSTVSSRG